jgi:hypothetical protein
MRRFPPLARRPAVLALAVPALAGLVLAGLVLAGLAAAGPAATPPVAATTPVATTPVATTPVATTPVATTPVPTGPPWLVRHLAPEDARLRGSTQVIDPVQQQDFALVPTRPVDPHFRLERFDLGGGHPVRGPVFAGSQLGLAGGFLWVSGAVTSGHGHGSVTAVLSQVTPRTLAVVRSWALVPPHPGADLETVPVAPGPRGSVWVGFQRTLLRISTATGAVIGRTQVPAGFAIVSVATDPAHRHLYVGTEPRRGGGTVFEFLARSGQPLAPVRGRPVRYAIAGVELTAVPGGVFGEFRSGMMGQVVRLSQPGLRNQPLHGAIFGFTQAASVVFGPGALFLADDGGATGCTSRGGAVRHTTTISALGSVGQLLAVNRGLEAAYGIGRHGLIEISPPASCWP